MESTTEQTCLCSAGLVPEGQCPHTTKQRRPKKAKPSVAGIGPGECVACKLISKQAHKKGVHPLGGKREIDTALLIGPVFCRIPKLDKKKEFPVRDTRWNFGAMQLKILEGWQDEFDGVFMYPDKSAHPASA